MLQLLQHWELGRIAQEQTARMTGGEGPKAADFKVLHMAVEELKDLEGQLYYLQREEADKADTLPLQAQAKEAAEEVLQSRTVSLDEVYEDIQRWTPAFKKEVDSLTSGPVVRALTTTYYRLGQWQS